MLPLLDASVWVRVDAERRLLERDGDSPEQRRDVARGVREERPFLREQRPWARTTVVAGGWVLPHGPETQPAAAQSVG